MRKLIPCLLLAALAACDLSTEAEVRNDANDFPVQSEWSANLTGVGTATVRGTTKIKQYAGSQFDAEATITGGLPVRAYQWRIFTGDCSVTTVAGGLTLFGTIQAYPDLTTDAAGSAKVTRFMAGALFTEFKYSVRVRLAQTATNWDGTSPLACGNLQRS